MKPGSLKKTYKFSSVPKPKRVKKASNVELQAQKRKQEKLKLVQNYEDSKEIDLSNSVFIKPVNKANIETSTNEYELVNKAQIDKIKKHNQKLLKNEQKVDQTIDKYVSYNDLSKENKLEKAFENLDEFKIKPNEIRNSNGYSKKFKKAIIYDNKIAPDDLLVVRKDAKKSFTRNFVDFWKNLFKKTKMLFVKIGKLFSKKKDDQKDDEIDFEKYIENADEEVVFGKKTKIAAEINDLYLTFRNPANPKEKNLVLRGASLKIYEGKVHAVIGESGSGKSVVTSLFYGLTGSNSIIESGKVKLYGLEVQDFTAYNWEKSKLRGRVVSAVFQNPMSILDPTMKVGKQIIEGMLINKIVKSKKEAYKEALKYLEMTKISNPKKVMSLYPHELSGGMIQRIAIAAIISLKPKILIMDEPTTALDPTVQALVLDIIRELQEKFKIAIVFITHDLGVVSSISDFINIMYAGQIVESGTKEEILIHPQHPYTWGLIVSMPDFNKEERLQVIRGAVPSSLNKIKGDAFAVRNDYALAMDFDVEPTIHQISPTHYVKSNLLNERAPEYTPPLIIRKLWNKYERSLVSLYGSKEKCFVDQKTYQYYLDQAQKHNDEVKNPSFKNLEEERAKEING